MRILKICRKRRCSQSFNIIKGVNLIKDKNGSLKAVCPWCKHRNLLTKSEINCLSLKKR